MHYVSGSVLLSVTSFHVLVFFVLRKNCRVVVALSHAHFCFSCPVVSQLSILCVCCSLDWSNAVLSYWSCVHIRYFYNSFLWFWYLWFSRFISCHVCLLKVFTHVSYQYLYKWLWLFFAYVYFWCRKINQPTHHSEGCRESLWGWQRMSFHFYPVLHSFYL